jgi:hypothetical protein
MAGPSPLDDDRIDELAELLQDADEYEVPAEGTFVVRSGTDVVWRVGGLTHGEHHPDVESASERFEELVEEIG